MTHLVLLDSSAADTAARAAHNGAIMDTNITHGFLGLVFVSATWAIIALRRILKQLAATPR